MTACADDLGHCTSAETSEDVADALGCAAEEAAAAADTDAAAGAPGHATAAAAQAPTAVDVEAELPAQGEEPLATQQQLRITVEVAQPAALPAEPAPDATADAAMDDAPVQPAAQTEPAAVPAGAAEVEASEGEELCRVCSREAGKKVGCCGQSCAMSLRARLLSLASLILWVGCRSMFHGWTCCGDHVEASKATSYEGIACLVKYLTRKVACLCR